jgi:hypothetical protein
MKMKSVSSCDPPNESSTFGAYHVAAQVEIAYAYGCEQVMNTGFSVVPHLIALPERNMILVAGGAASLRLAVFQVPRVLFSAAMFKRKHINTFSWLYILAILCPDS